MMVPLCIDLDGTLCREDTLLVLLRRKPWLLVWLLRGRAVFKQRIARCVPLDPAALAYNDELLAFLRAEKAGGRELWLVTAADRTVAEKVAEHFDGLFAGVLASDGAVNLKGERKLRALEAKFPSGFDYAGNSAPDLPIWRRARNAIVVNAAPGVLRRARSLSNVARVFR